MNLSGKQSGDESLLILLDLYALNKLELRSENEDHKVLSLYHESLLPYNCLKNGILLYGSHQNVSCKSEYVFLY